jgi:hypothetical protein
MYEGKSFHFERKTFFGRWVFKKRMKKFRNEFTKVKESELLGTIESNDFICEEKLINKINIVMGLAPKQRIRRKYYLYIMRERDLIDDISLGNYLSFARKFPSIGLDTFEPKRFTLKNDKHLKVFALRAKTNFCFIENATSFLGHFKFNKKKLKKYLKGTTLTKKEKGIFLKGLKTKVHQTRLTNKKYLDKIISLRPKITGKLPIQKSDHISKGIKELGTSLRINLFKKFTPFQIVLLNKVIERFQQRIDNANWINIQLYDIEDNIIEEIRIDSPMEVYRLCIKLFKKEMSELKINHLFNGIPLNYYDFLGAAYEMRTINNDFLIELYKIKEFWSPDKSFWQKVRVWASVLSGVATIFTPPPYNYLISFGLIAIEYYNKPADKPSYEHSIFGEIK